MFDAAAYKLVRLVQIPRYVEYLRGENKEFDQMIDKKKEID